MPIKFLRDARPTEATNYGEYKAGKVFGGLTKAQEQRWIRRGAAVPHAGSKKKKGRKKKTAKKAASSGKASAGADG